MHSERPPRHGRREAVQARAQRPLRRRAPPARPACRRRSGEPRAAAGPRSSAPAHEARSRDDLARRATVQALQVADLGGVLALAPRDAPTSWPRAAPRSRPPRTRARPRRSSAAGSGTCSSTWERMPSSYAPSRRGRRCAVVAGSTESSCGRRRAIADRRLGDLHARQPPAEAAAVQLAQQRAVAAADLERAGRLESPPERAQRAARGRPCRPLPARASARTAAACGPARRVGVARRSGRGAAESSTAGIIVGAMTGKLTASLREAPATVPALAAIALFVVWATDQAGYPLTHWAPGGADRAGAARRSRSASCACALARGAHGRADRARLPGRLHGAQLPVDPVGGGPGDAWEGATGRCSTCSCSRCSPAGRQRGAQRRAAARRVDLARSSGWRCSSSLHVDAAAPARALQSAASGRAPASIRAAMPTPTRRSG